MFQNDVSLFHLIVSLFQYSETAVSFCQEET